MKGAFLDRERNNGHFNWVGVFPLAVVQTRWSSVLAAEDDVGDSRLGNRDFVDCKSRNWIIQVVLILFENRVGRFLLEA